MSEDFEIVKEEIKVSLDDLDKRMEDEAAEVQEEPEQVDLREIKLSLNEIAEYAWDASHAYRIRQDIIDNYPEIDKRNAFIHLLGDDKERIALLSMTAFAIQNAGAPDAKAFIEGVHQVISMKYLLDGWKFGRRHDEENKETPDVAHLKFWTEEKRAPYAIFFGVVKGLVGLFDGNYSQLTELQQKISEEAE